MKRKTNYEGLRVFDQIRTGLKQAIANARGDQNLKTTVRTKPDSVRRKAN